jgi:hypothetical protein
VQRAIDIDNDQMLPRRALICSGVGAKTAVPASSRGTGQGKRFRLDLADHVLFLPSDMPHEVVCPAAAKMKRAPLILRARSFRSAVARRECRAEAPVHAGQYRSGNEGRRVAMPPLVFHGVIPGALFAGYQRHAVWH